MKSYNFSPNTKGIDIWHLVFRELILYGLFPDFFLMFFLGGGKQQNKQNVVEHIFSSWIEMGDVDKQLNILIGERRLPAAGS